MSERGISSVVHGFCVVFIAAVLGLVMFLFMIDAVTPNAGEEAVLINKPILFGDEGVVSTSVKSGRTYVWWTTQHLIVNMQPRQYRIHFEDLMSKDGVPLDFDPVIRVRVIDSVKLVREFGPKWYENNVEAEFSNSVRQAVRKHGMNETAINTTALEEIDAEITKNMQDYIKYVGLPLEMIAVTMGKANPPDAIKNQRIDTAAQEQRKITEDFRKTAEDARKNAEMSRATADNAYREAMQLSPNQFLQLENIKMQRDVCAGGHCTFLIGGTGVQPVFDVKK